MPTLVVVPNPAAPSNVVAVNGSGFANAKTRLTLDGAGATTNIFRPKKDGSFNVGITVSSTPKTQLLVAQQQANGVWSEKARVSIVVQSIVTPPPPPPPPTDGEVISPGTDIKAKLDAGVRKFILRGGTHRLSLGSGDSPYRDVSMSAYVGEVPIIDGSGVQSFVYIGTQSGTWKLADLTIRNFLPEDQGVIGIGDSCRIEMTRMKMIGSGVPSGNNDHGVYFHGTGTGLLTDCEVTAFPGAAIQSYRGNPQKVVVNGGKMHGLYIGAFIYSGHMDFTNVDIRGTLTWDVDIQLPASATFTNCTGRGTDGKPKIVPEHS